MRDPNSYRCRLPALIAAGSVAALIAFAWVPPAPAQTGTEYRDRPGASAATRSAANEREFVVTTVHVDGNAHTRGDAKHPPEAFVEEALPAGGGLLRTQPDAEGAWRMRAFIFAPSQVVVFQGAPVTLTFVGVQGPSHRIQVDGVSEVIELKRGQVRSVSVAADTPGSIGFRSLDRLPSMQGSVIVLPKP